MAMLATISGGFLPQVYDARSIAPDGINDYYSSGQWDIADGKTGTAIWWGINAASGLRSILNNNGQRFMVRVDDFGVLFVRANDPSNVRALEADFHTVWPQPPQGYSTLLAASWDMAVQDRIHFVRDGVSMTPRIQTFVLNADLNYSRSAWGMMGRDNGLNLMEGNTSIIWLDTVYRDISDPAVFKDVMLPNGPIKDPGADGSNWFGAQPYFYQSRRGGTVASFATIRGRSAGTTWTENGAFGDGGTSYVRP